MTPPAIRELFANLGREAAFQEAVSRLTRDRQARVSLAGLTLAAKGVYLTMLRRALERPLIVVCGGNRQAEDLLELCGAFHTLIEDGGELAPQMIPALDVLPSQRLSPHSEISEQRAVGLWRLAGGGTGITIAPVGGALVRTAAASFYRQLALTLRAGEETPLDDVIAHLESIGYERREPVEMAGDYSVRGGILDVFPAESSRPVRIELFGDEIESIRRFDVETQRSVLKIPEVTVLPLMEFPKTREVLRELAEKLDDPDWIPSPGDVFPGWELMTPLVRPREHSLFTLSPEAVAVIDEPEEVAAASGRLWKRLEEGGESAEAVAEAVYFRWGELRASIEGRAEVELRELELGAAEGVETLRIETRPMAGFRGNVPLAVKEARELVANGHHVMFCAATLGDLERLADILREYSIPFQVAVTSEDASQARLAERGYLGGSEANTLITRARVRRGALFVGRQVALIGSDDLFEARVEARTGPRREQMAAFRTGAADLEPGDYVVHAVHGIGKFLGVRELEQNGQHGDFLLLEYAGEAKLYVPLARLDLIEKFRGGGDAAPQLDKLGGVTWERTKKRVKAKMRDMAEELLKLYAQRRLAEGFAFSRDSNWQREFEDAFEFTETKDQLDAVEQIKRDMESPHPMDRLLCGDVGFGKTEVAMRAAFKALGDGKQVAVLAPTTVLCFQHYETFKRRFAPFPVRIEMLSRFVDAKQTKQVIEDVAEGKVDVVVGTHRLLSKDVVFKDLGLLVVDEEQRFGVRHKERIKQIQQNVDVLTMSATPIPRTLHMSLLGLRDLSVIETPPKDRLAIHTVVAKFDKNLIRTAIEQEMSRGGQVYYVHNRVDTIFERAAMIQELLPECRIGVGHGQMGEAELEKVLLGFMRHEYDVFVCTKIVENGLDISLANTMIIEHADRYGLSELYQLRGRVGRSNRRAYAYLLVPADAELSEVARKRLAALKEFSDLGAGFKIAALDLELRGAGNLLGGEQHGHIEAVGFDMYVRLLDETVRELKGEETAPQIHSALNLGLEARIPPEYISNEQQRLRAYKSIADVNSEEQAAKVLAEMEDRYGPAPEVVKTLLKFARVKGEAERMGVEAADRRGGLLNVKFHPSSKVDPVKLMAMVSRTKGAKFTPAGVLQMPLDGVSEGTRVLAVLDDALRELK